VFELSRANEILKAASVFFATELDADRTNRSSSIQSLRETRPGSPGDFDWSSLFNNLAWWTPGGRRNRRK
jgi:hypothetical protein